MEIFLSQREVETEKEELSWHQLRNYLTRLMSYLRKQTGYLQSVMSLNLRLAVFPFNFLS
jgi:predicted transcriptional regulator of viral defense system